MGAYPHARGPRAEQDGPWQVSPSEPSQGRPGAGDDEAAQAPLSTQVALAFLLSFSAVAVGLGAARAATTSYVPVLLEEIAQRPGLIGLTMLSNALMGNPVGIKPRLALAG